MWSISGIYTAAQPPPPKLPPKKIESNRKYPSPNPGETTPQTHSRAAKMTRVLEARRENGLKINFHLRFLYVHFKIFSKISSLTWLFDETCKIFPLAFLNSFRFIINFQNSKTVP